MIMRPALSCLRGARISVIGVLIGMTGSSHSIPCGCMQIVRGGYLGVKMRSRASLWSGS